MFASVKADKTLILSQQRELMNHLSELDKKLDLATTDEEQDEILAMIDQTLKQVEMMMNASDQINKVQGRWANQEGLKASFRLMSPWDKTVGAFTDQNPSVVFKKAPIEESHLFAAEVEVEDNSIQRASLRELKIEGDAIVSEKGQTFFQAANIDTFGMNGELKLSPIGACPLRTEKEDLLSSLRFSVSANLQTMIKAPWLESESDTIVTSTLF